MKKPAIATRRVSSGVNARKNVWANHLRAAYRSGLEAALASAIAAAGLTVQFETHRIPYLIPADCHHYTPDFVLANGIMIESKGLFTIEDRRKMILVRDQHPGIDIRMVFQNANAKLNKGSPTSYAMWAVKNGFQYAHRGIPHEWLTEPCDHDRAIAAQKFIRSK